MSTRSNIVLITPDNKVHQFYHHCDGYLSGVGEELRKFLVFSLGMKHIHDMNSNDESNTDIYHFMLKELLKDDSYEDEYILDLDSNNNLHSDIEFLYLIKDSNLYYVDAWDLYSKVDSNKDLIDYVIKDNNKIDLCKVLHDD